MLHQWFTCVHLLDTYLANLKEGFQLSFHYPSVSIRAAQSGLRSAPACRMRWVCHHLFRSYDRNPSNIANIRLHFCLRTHDFDRKVTNFPSKKERNLQLFPSKKERHTKIFPFQKERHLKAMTHGGRICCKNRPCISYGQEIQKSISPQALLSNRLMTKAI